MISPIELLFHEILSVNDFFAMEAPSVDSALSDDSRWLRNEYAVGVLNSNIDGGAIHNYYLGIGHSAGCQDQAEI